MRRRKQRAWLAVILIFCLLSGVLTPGLAGADDGSNGPDLVVESITWSPQVPAMDDTVTFTVGIRNSGDAPANAFLAGCYIDDILADSVVVNTLGPGAMTTGTFTWKAEAGSHNVVAVADAENVIAESDEANNSTGFALSVIACDLVIESITWSPALPSVGEEVTFTVTVKNQGDDKAAFSNAELYIDGNYRGYRGVQATKAGAATQVTFPWAAQAGPHIIQAVADSLGQIKESSETNNAKVVNFSTAAADLVVSSITWTPEDFVESDNVTFTATLKNEGLGQSSASNLDFYIDDVYQTSIYVAQLDSENTTTKTFIWKATVGFHTVTAVADATHRVIESDENNNKCTEELPNLAPDIIVDSIVWTPSAPVLDHRVTFAVTLKNNGESMVGYSRMYFFIDNERWEHDIQWIEARGTATGFFHWFMEPGTHTIKVVADGENDIIESNETNNTKTVKLSPSNPTFPDLVIQSISRNVDTPSPGERVTFTVTVKNQGKSMATPSHVAYYIDDIYVKEAYVGEIDAGGVETLDFEWQACAGSHVFKAVLDHDTLLDESNEDNNEKNSEVSVPAPDLVIRDVTWSPSDPSPGEAVNFTITAGNVGSDVAGQNRIAYYIDGSPRGYHDVQELKINGTTTKTLTWTAQAGPHVIRIVIDEEGRITETNEANNEKIIALPAPDLAVRDITWSPANPTENATVTFTVSMGNDGSGRAEASRIGLLIEGLGFKEHRETAGLDSGGSTSATFEWTGVAGSFTVSATADVDDILLESNESNNERSAVLTVFRTASEAEGPFSEPETPGETGLEELEEGVRLNDMSSYISLGENIVLNLGASNPLDNPVMTVEMVLQLPSGISILSPEFEKGEKGRYAASYTVEPGQKMEIEVLLEAEREGSFNIMGDLSYYLSDDKVAAEHQILTLPVTVGEGEASGTGPALMEFLTSTWTLLGVAVLAGIALLVLLKIRRSRQTAAG